MPKPKSPQIRALVLNHYQNGKKPTEIFCDVFNKTLSLRTIYRWCADLDKTGKTVPSPNFRVGRPITVCIEIHREQVKKLLEEKNSMRSISRQLNLSFSSVRRMVAQLKLKVIEVYLK